MTEAQPWISTGGGGGPNAVQWIKITVEGFSEYQMVANDKLSLEYIPDDTNTITIGTSTTQSNPAGFTCQQWTGAAVWKYN